MHNLIKWRMKWFDFIVPSIEYLCVSVKWPNFSTLLFTRFLNLRKWANKEEQDVRWAVPVVSYHIQVSRKANEKVSVCIEPDQPVIMLQPSHHSSPFMLHYFCQFFCGCQNWPNTLLNSLLLFWTKKWSIIFTKEEKPRIKVVQFHLECQVQSSIGVPTSTRF